MSDGDSSGIRKNWRKLCGERVMWKVSALDHWYQYVTRNFKRPHHKQKEMTQLHWRKERKKKKCIVICLFQQEVSKEEQKEDNKRSPLLDQIVGRNRIWAPNLTKILYLGLLGWKIVQKIKFSWQSETFGPLLGLTLWISFGEFSDVLGCEAAAQGNFCSKRETRIFEVDYPAERGKLFASPVYDDEWSTKKEALLYVFLILSRPRFWRKTLQAILWSFQILIQKDILMSLCRHHKQWLVDRMHGESGGNAFAWNIKLCIILFDRFLMPRVTHLKRPVWLVWPCADINVPPNWMKLEFICLFW